MKAIYSKRVVLPTGVKEATIFIKNGKIDSITEGYQLFENLENVGENVIMAGIIDPHVHINEPGRTEWEGFDTATKAAAAGGVTTMIEMPLNASPVTTNVAAFEQKLKATEGKMHVNCGFYGGLIPSNFKDLEPLIKAGIWGVKCFMTHSGIDEFPNVSEADLLKAMPLIAQFNMPLLAHAELDTPHPMQNYFKKNPTLYKAYLKSRPKSWENHAIDMMVKLCEKTQCPTHIVHLSSADRLFLLKTSKKRLKLTVETTPQYLYFNAENIPDAKTVFKCAPPIREQANNEKLWAALKAGVIDFLGSDHSPAPPNIKEIETGNLAKAWGGIAGVQFTLPVFWTKAVDKGFNLNEVSKILSENPAKFLGLDKKGRIEKGYDADLVIWNPEKKFMVAEKDIHFRHKISPYLGEILRGSVEQTYIYGVKVFDKGQFTYLNGGKVLLKKNF
jgi:allantoinase